MSTANSHAHSSHLAHHFKTMDQQFSAAKLGTWLFLATEILMFGGTFVAYIIFHQLYPETFAEGASHLDWQLGALNTVILIFSSFTMATAIHYAQKGDRKKSMNLLLVTFICGCLFLVVKAIEYEHKFHLGLNPGALFHYTEGHAANLAMYFSFYFMMTGIHGFHVMIGMGLILWVWRRSGKGEFSPEYYTPIECVGLFWHLVDLIWIYLFPLLYLVG